MPLSRCTLGSVALTAVLSISGQAVSSRDDAWGGPAWQRYQGPGDEAGYAARGDGPYEGDPRPAMSAGGPAPLFQDPSWGNGDASSPRRGGAGYGEYREDDPYAWRQGGPSRPVGQVLTGPNLGSGFEEAPPAAHPWQIAPHYHADYQGPAIRPRGLPDGLGLVPGQVRPVPSPDFGTPTLETYPGYRFRGDPPAHLGQWQSAPYDSAYRFRPLTEQEQGRWGQGPEHRPGYPQDMYGVPLRGDPSLQPEAAFGFEPTPWRAR